MDGYKKSVSGQEQMVPGCAGEAKFEYYEKFLPWKDGQALNSVSGEVVESLSLEVFRKCVDVVLKGRGLVVNVTKLG